VSPQASEKADQHRPRSSAIGETGTGRAKSSLVQCPLTGVLFIGGGLVGYGNQLLTLLED